MLKAVYSHFWGVTSNERGRAPLCVIVQVQDSKRGRGVEAADTPAGA